jgi:hypothetical protein
LQGVIEEATQGPARINDAVKLATIAARSICDAEDMILSVYVRSDCAATGFEEEGRLSLCPILVRNCNAGGSLGITAELKNAVNSHFSEVYLDETLRS